MSILSCYRFSVTKLNRTKNFYFLLGFQSLAEESRIISLRINVYHSNYYDKYLLLILILTTIPHNGNRCRGGNIMIAKILLNLSFNIYYLFRTLPLFRITISNHFFVSSPIDPAFPFFLPLPFCLFKVIQWAKRIQVSVNFSYLWVDSLLDYFNSQPRIYIFSIILIK